jgi:hypothetical protein
MQRDQSRREIVSLPHVLNVHQDGQMNKLAERKSTVCGLSGFGGNAVGDVSSALSILIADVLGVGVMRMDNRTMLARSRTAESASWRKWSALRAGAIHLCIVPATFGCPTIAYVQSSD